MRERKFYNLNKLVKDLQSNPTLDIQAYIDDFIKERDSKKVIYEFFDDLCNTPDLLTRIEYLKLLSIVDEIGEDNFIPLLIKMGRLVLKDQRSTEFILDTIYNLLLRINLDKKLYYELNIYLNDVFESWQDNRKIIVYAGISIILKKTYPELMTKDYTEYEVGEIKEILKNLNIFKDL